MAAWLSVLCEVDDLLEQESRLNFVRDVLLDSTSILQGGLVDLDVKSESAHTPGEMAAASKVHQISYAFRNHVQQLLSPDLYCLFIREITEHWVGAMKESHFQKQPCPNVEHYMEIRAQTCGLPPFFTLLESCWMSSYHKRSTALQGLQGCVEIIVGIQNDLIGLEKD
ncbi:hypothetical protein K402DRAFT_467587 [Aulographum hederae CBS 113979]|uniref:Terpenoid synthase n=1 Tax=Aulographum hederae CBS 113979 TaxID=1176131 RepID=A0A6G1GKD6_9PEZI|nr:hypothetical protein K402DRAFT_467587 [Aulographum hederae CBS 113979]